MRGRRWFSPAASALLDATGERDASVAITKLAEALIDEAGFDQPAFPPHILASLQDVREVRRVEMEGAARLLPEGDRLVIEVNRNHTSAKQNFSIDHEVTHTLLPTYRRQAIDDSATGRFFAGSEEELLCDIGASALLLDRRWLRPLALDAGPLLSTVFQMAELFEASLEATAFKLAQLNLWPCAFVLWEEGYRKDDRVSDDQPLLAGWESVGRPDPKLRVRSVYASRSFGHHLPHNKSVGEASLVAECCRTGLPTSGVEDFDLGDRRAIRPCWDNANVPYRSGSEVRRRVISLLRPSGSHSTSASVPPAYPLEIM